MLALLLATDDQLVDAGASIHTADFAGRWGSHEEESFAAAAMQLRDSGLAVPRATQLGLEPELLHAAIRSGRLVRLADDLVYLPEQVDEIISRIQPMNEFTVAEFRDALGVSRRQAVPVLEWLDAQGWTSRRGDRRSIRRRPPPPEPDARPR
jgi:selenocysteine-specific elongation factor